MKKINKLEILIKLFQKIKSFQFLHQNKNQKNKIIVKEIVIRLLKPQQLYIIQILLIQHFKLLQDLH